MKQLCLRWLVCACVVPILCAKDSPDKATVMLPMRDGVNLATDIYKPAGPGPFPVVLSRTPYNKDMFPGFAKEANERGYALVAQDTRGRFASQGENLPFHLDTHDGFDTIEWVAKQ